MTCFVFANGMTSQKSEMSQDGGRILEYRQSKKDDV